MFQGYESLKRLLPLLLADGEGNVHRYEQDSGFYALLLGALGVGLDLDLRDRHFTGSLFSVLSWRGVLRF